jgi:hypothetical protein
VEITDRNYLTLVIRAWLYWSLFSWNSKSLSKFCVHFLHRILTESVKSGLNVALNVTVLICTTTGMCVRMSVFFTLFHFCNLRSLSSFKSETVFYVTKIGKNILSYHFCSYFRCRDTKSWITPYFPNVFSGTWATLRKVSIGFVMYLSVRPSVHVEALGCHWNNVHEI